MVNKNSRARMLSAIGEAVVREVNIRNLSEFFKEKYTFSVNSELLQVIIWPKLQETSKIR